MNRTPSRTRVKVCGLTTATDRDVAIAAGVDAVGVISEVPVETPRDVSRTVARKLVRDVPPFVTSVLVTMPTSVDDAVSIQERVQADAIQVHGGLAPDAIGTLRDRLTVDVIAAVDHEQDDIDAYAEHSDLLLVDSRTPEGAGGTGEIHDWKRTRELVTRLETPVALAGGLTPENVASAIETVGPYAVDTASGVEREGGQKDHEAVHSFVDAVLEVAV